MKASFFSAFQYLIFFGIVLFVTSVKGVCEEGINNCNKDNAIKTERINNASGVSENTAEMLHGELLLRY